jgi:hypothetical protein
MSALQNKSRPHRSGQEWLDPGNFGDDDKVSSLSLAQANTVDMVKIFKHYSLDINSENKTACCPFSFHQDDDPSFLFYPASNSFYCFGCKSGGGPAVFVSLFENISRMQAVKKLINNFDSEKADPNLFIKLKEKEDLCIAFAVMIRNFLIKNNDEKSWKFTDEMCRGFDRLINGHIVDVGGVKHVFKKFEKSIKDYECQ